MARAKRHYIPGYIWHITHRCHKREFLLKFPRDRRRWIEWLYQAKKRYSGLSVFIETMKKGLGYRAKGRKIIGAEDTFELREAVAPFGNADNLDSGNTYLWNQ
jgi:hypothetical protein